MNAELIPETIAPREGEDLDPKKLADFLKGKLPGADDETIIIEQFAGGHANLTYLLTVGDKEYVLRRPPLGPLPPLAHDMAREHRVLSALNQAYPLAPVAHLFSDDESIVGAPFFIMERRRGTVVRKQIPPEFGGGKDAKVNRTLSEVLIRSLAQLHKVDYEAIGLGDLGKAKGFMKRQMRGWPQAYHRSKVEEIPDAADLIVWLKENVPEKYNGAIIHNDWRLDNIMIDSDDPSKVVAAFDWDMCTIGEPLADLGTLLSLWLEEGETFAGGSFKDIMPSKLPGFMSRKEAVALYADETGFDLSQMNYYYCFGMFKMAIVALQIYKRFKEGQTKDERFREFDVAAEMLLQRADEVRQTPAL